MQELQRYTLDRRIGKGGFGQVFQGWDERLQRCVAMKILDKEHSGEQEAQILAQLNHPQLIGIYDYVERPANNYLVMEFFPGKPINEMGLSLEDILHYGILLCQALTHVHQRNIIHCDLKPANILIADDGSCKIMDFGSAQYRDTVAEKIVGTPDFMAPEQRRGERVGEFSDVYSLGKVLETLVQQCPRESVPYRLSKIIWKATELEPSKRYFAVYELQAQLVSVRNSLPHWTVLQQLVPEFGDYWEEVSSVFNSVKAHLPTVLLSCLLPAIITIFLLSSSLVSPEFYQPIFQWLYAPILVMLVGLFSLPLATMVVFCLALPPLLVYYPSLGVILTVIVLGLSPIIYRHPMVFLTLLLLTSLEIPLLILFYALVMGYHYGSMSGALAGFLLPIIQGAQHGLVATTGYQQWLAEPMQYSESWWMHVWLQTDWSHVWELWTMPWSWPIEAFHLPIYAGVVGLLMGWLGRKGNVGMGLVIAVSSMLGYFLVVPETFVHVFGALVLFMLWYWLNHRWQAAAVARINTVRAQQPTAIFDLQEDPGNLELVHEGQ